MKNRTALSVESVVDDLESAADGLDSENWVWMTEAADNMRVAADLLTLAMEPVRLLVCKGKHGDVYYLATGFKLYEAALHHVKSLNEEGWFFTAEEAFPGVDPKNPPYSETQIQDAVDDDLRSVMEHKNQNWVRTRQEFLRWKAGDVYLNRAINEDDGEAAWEFMKLRRDHEYENFELVTL